MKVSRWILGLAGVAALLAGCGEESREAKARQAHPEATREAGKYARTDKFRTARFDKLLISLEGTESAQNVGVLMAVERGFFADVGLEVWAGSPLEPNRPAAYVAKGIDDFGLVQMPQVVLGREEGMPIVALGSVVTQPTAAMIWLEESKIGGIADLRGKTIALPGAPFQASLLQAVLARAGLTLDDVKLKRVGYEVVPTLLAGQADAIFGGSWNLEGVELESLGEEPVITRLQDLGVPEYEESVVVARTDFVAEEPELVRDFMSAVARGTAAAMEEPLTAVEVIRDAIGAVPRTDRGMVEAQVKSTLPLLSRNGYMNPGLTEGLVDWMYEEGMIQRQRPSEELLTNEYR